MKIYSGIISFKGTHGSRLRLSHEYQLQFFNRYPVQFSTGRVVQFSATTYKYRHNGVLIDILFYVYVITPEMWHQFTLGSGISLVQKGSMSMVITMRVFGK